MYCFACIFSLRGSLAWQLQLRLEPWGQFAWFGIWLHHLLAVRFGESFFKKMFMHLFGCACCSCSCAAQDLLLIVVAYETLSFTMEIQFSDQRQNPNPLHQEPRGLSPWTTREVLEALTFVHLFPVCKRQITVMLTSKSNSRLL